MQGSEIWIFKTAAVFVVLLLVNFFLKRIVNYVRCHLLSASSHLRDELLKIVCAPLAVIIWTAGLAYVLDVLSIEFEFPGIKVGFHSLRNAIIVFCIGWMLLRWRKVVQESFAARNSPTAPVIGRIMSFGIMLITVLLILQILGIDILPLVAFGGVGAAAIGFAARDVIANFFGGFMLYITRPFAAGDEILLSDRQVEGIVEEIGWVRTSIRDKDKRPIYLPNSIFAHQLVINISRRSHRRILETIGLRYEDISKLDPLLIEIKEKIKALPAIDASLPVLIFLSAFKDASIEIYIDLYTHATSLEKYMAVKQSVLLQIQELLNQHGAEMPYPTTVVQLKHLDKVLSEV